MLIKTETSSELQIWPKAANVIATRRSAAIKAAARAISLAAR